MSKWQVVPIEPNDSMMDAIKTADMSYNAWKGALKFAPAPPQSRRVKPYAWRCQYREKTFVSQWIDCTDEELEEHKKRGAPTQIVYFYVNQPYLYTRPAPATVLQERINHLEAQNKIIKDANKDLHEKISHLQKLNEQLITAVEESVALAKKLKKEKTAAIKLWKRSK